MALAPNPESVPIFRVGSKLEGWDPLVLLIDKPKGLTSFDVIRRLRRIAPIRKIGHAGTLDPMATGLLICLSGKATRLMNHFMGQRKIYTGVIRLGQTTPSFDAETEVNQEKDASNVSDTDIEQALTQLTGEITQQTPVYSAVKVGGERLYKKARRGEKVVLPFRHVTVHEFLITSRNGVDLSFQVTCSSGTYVRSLAHDLGQLVGVGGHLVELRRTMSGSLSVDEAWPLSELLEQNQPVLGDG
ncbi:tRNA pseudouridine(55) synthase TruB [bacterium]|nr:tRNA pseudouridine(55) synthase TruB [bacterium]